MIVTAGGMKVVVVEFPWISVLGIMWETVIVLKSMYYYYGTVQDLCTIWHTLPWKVEGHAICKMSSEAESWQITCLDELYNITHLRTIIIDLVLMY